MVLVGYWPLNEDAGTRAHDYSGNDNHGSLSGGISRGKGLHSSTAYDFDGADDSVKVSNSVVSGSTMTISAWVNIDGVGGSSWNRTVDVQDGANGNAHGFVWDEDDNRHGLFTPSGSVYVGSDIETGEWLHLVGVIREGKAEFYKNGKLEASKNVSSSFTDLKVCIGKRYDKNDHTNGRISEVRIYNRPLTKNEINYLYSTGKRGLQTTMKKSS